MVNAFIKSFKHDGSNHRLWEHLFLIDEDEHYYYLGANKAKVIEDDGREWRAPEGALYILSKDRFFNVIVMFKGNKEIEYYVNIASPIAKISDQVFSFIDYDLDLKRNKDKTIKELDWGEYAANSSSYGYSPKLKKVIEMTLKEVKWMIVSGEHPFDDLDNKKMYDKFLVKLSNLNLPRKE